MRGEPESKQKVKAQTGNKTKSEGRERVREGAREREQVRSGSDATFYTHTLSVSQLLTANS